MCVVSMIHDYFEPRIPDPNSIGGIDWSHVKIETSTPTSTSDEWARAVADLRTLIDEFRRALEAAKTVDRLTGQPDCVDPDKAKLEARVAMLEAIIARQGVVY